MKFYSASKFSMVIVPPKYSEKTKESKLLVRSFKHIYKIAGLGIAAGVSGLLSFPLFQQDRRVSVDLPTQTSEIQDMDESFQSSMQETEKAASESADSSFAAAPAAEPEAGQSYTLEEALELEARQIEAAEANPASGSGIGIFDSGDLAITLIVLAVIFGG